jgi:hypothetical protein
MIDSNIISGIADNGKGDCSNPIRFDKRIIL